MNNTRVMILAAGQADRWTEPYPKQLARIAGVPLLDRTVSQLAAWGLRPTVITHNIGITDFIGSRNLCNVWPPYRHRWTCETLLSSFPLWGNPTIVLLGDVVFGDRDLADVLAPTDYITIYHNTDIGELMAIQFNKVHADRVKTKLFDVVEDSAAGRCRGKMWEWYNRIRIGGGIRSVRLNRSMDIDTVEDWHEINAIYTRGRQDMADAWAGVKPYRGGGER